jgi:hypothetical protein
MVSARAQFTGGHVRGVNLVNLSTSRQPHRNTTKIKGFNLLGRQVDRLTYTHAMSSNVNLRGAAETVHITEQS